MSLTITPAFLESRTGVAFLFGSAAFDSGVLPGPSNVGAVSGSVAMPTLHVSGRAPIALGPIATAGLWVAAGSSPWVAFFPPELASSPIADGESATVSWPDGWATCGLGPAVAASGVPVVPPGPLYRPPAATTTMRVGFNVMDVIPLQANTLYANYFNQAHGFIDGNIVRNIGSSFVDGGINLTVPTYQGDGKALANIPPGDYVLLWDGASNAELVCTSGTVVETGTAVLTGAADNIRHYTIGGDSTHYGPDLQVRIHAVSGTAADFSNPRLYDAGTDLAHPPKYLPSAIARLNAGSAPQCLRFLDPLGGNAGNTVDYQDWQPPYMSRAVPLRTVTAPITRIEPYTGTGYTFGANFGLILQLTTSGPHGLALGQVGQIVGYGSTPAVPLAGGGSTSLDGHLVYCYPIDATHLAVLDCSITAAIAGTVVPTGTLPAVTVTIGNGIPLDDMIEVCNLANCDFYFNTCASATQGGLAGCAARIAARLNPGLKLRVECTNEPWNFITVYYYHIERGHLMGGDPGNFYWPLGYVALATEHWRWMRDAWVGAGRDAADFRSVVGTEQGSTQATTWIAQELHAAGVVPDEVCIGAYMFNADQSGNPPVGASALIRGLSVAQHVDLLALNYAFGHYANLAAMHLACFAPYSELAHIRPIVYEGGPAYLPCDGITSDVYARFNHAIARHPRFWGIYQDYLRTLQESGFTHFHDFNVGDLDRTSGEGWSTYLGTAMLAYQPGDAAQDAVQVDQPTRMDLIRSVTGGAVAAWQRRAAGGVVTPTLASVAVTPAGPTVAAGSTRQLAATGTYSDGSTRDLTAVAAWSSSAPSVATVGSSGLASGVAAGTATVSAASGGVVGSTAVTVTGTTPPPPPPAPTAAGTLRFLGPRRLGRRRA